MGPSISKRVFPRILFAFFLIVSIQVSTAESKEKVIIFHAGSLTVPLAKIEKDFEAANPGIDILREAGGSTKMARMITELGKPADIMASADYKVIDKTLIPAMADWNIRFATNQLVLCYTAMPTKSMPTIGPRSFRKKRSCGATQIPTWIHVDTAA